MKNVSKSPRGRASQPVVSVIIPFLNPGPFLEEAIQSVIAQTYTDWELLLVDDGTTDGGTRIARGFAEKNPERIFYLEHAGHKNLGTPASRNVGIRRARGEYIAFLDADDVWMEDKLGRQTALLEAHPDVAMTYGPFLRWYSWAGNSGKEVQDYPQDVMVSGGTVILAPRALEMLIRGLGFDIYPTGILVRRRAALAVDGFAERFRGRMQLFEDLSFCAKLAIRENMLITDTPCFRYRQHPDCCSAAVLRLGIYDKLWIDFLRWLSSYLVEFV